MAQQKPDKSADRRIRILKTDLILYFLLSRFRSWRLSSSEYIHLTCNSVGIQKKRKSTEGF